MIIFNDWISLIRIFFIGVGSYIGLILILRISGNRTLSKMNSFDFIITIALGSTFATAVLQKSVALVDALFAFSLLVGMQFLTTWLSVRSKKFSDLIKSEPVLLFINGDYLHQAMKNAHVTDEEVQAAIRQQGISDSSKVICVVLESNGKLSVTQKM